MSLRAFLPGGVIVAALTAAAVLALLVALGIRGEGPLAIGIGDADGSARLDGGGSAALAQPTPGVRETAPVVLPDGGIAAPAAGTPARRNTSLRGATNGRQEAGRRVTRRTPSRGAPVSSPNQPTTTTSPTNTATRPAATATPGPAPAKVRDRGESAPAPAVKKQRTAPGGSATPAPVPIQQVPAPTAPQLDRSTAPAPSPAGTPGGAPITRVPPPSATP